MVDFDLDTFVRGQAVCPDCGFQWEATVPYGQFFTLECTHCGGLVGELFDPQLVIV